MTADTRPLGRKEPTHYDHVEAYPLATIEAEARPKKQPVAPGFNWYTGFDNPSQGADGRYYLPAKNLGTIRGGHCVCLQPAPVHSESPGPSEQDSEAFYRFYNQGQEGACEGFGHARRFSLVHRITFDAFHLYDDAQRMEGTFIPGGGSAEEGTTNDAICKALRKWGVHRQEGEHAARGQLDPRTIAIKKNRWAKTADEILGVLGYTSGEAIPLLNSWGEDYPEVVYMAPEVLERLMREGGECDVLTER